MDSTELDDAGVVDPTGRGNVPAEPAGALREGGETGLNRDDEMTDSGGKGGPGLQAVPPSAKANGEETIRERRDPRPRRAMRQPSSARPARTRGLILPQARPGEDTDWIDTSGACPLWRAIGPYLWLLDQQGDLLHPNGRFPAVMIARSPLPADIVAKWGLEPVAAAHDLLLKACPIGGLEIAPDRAEAEARMKRLSPAELLRAAGRGEYEWKINAEATRYHLLLAARSNGCFPPTCSRETAPTEESDFVSFPEPVCRWVFALWPLGGHPDWAVGRSTIETAGCGLFPMSVRKKGSRLFPYEGKTSQCSDPKSLPEGPFTLFDEVNLTVTIGGPNFRGSIVNHRGEPGGNATIARWDDQIGLVVNNEDDIQPFHEVTTDYGEDFEVAPWAPRPTMVTLRTGGNHLTVAADGIDARTDVIAMLGNPAGLKNIKFCAIAPAGGDGRSEWVEIKGDEMGWTAGLMATQWFCLFVQDMTWWWVKEKDCPPELMGLLPVGIHRTWPANPHTPCDIHWVERQCTVAELLDRKGSPNQQLEWEGQEMARDIQIFECGYFIPPGVSHSSIHCPATRTPDVLTARAEWSLWLIKNGTHRFLAAPQGTVGDLKDLVAERLEINPLLLSIVVANDTPGEDLALAEAGLTDQSLFDIVLRGPRGGGRPDGQKRRRKRQKEEDRRPVGGPARGKDGPAEGYNKQATLESGPPQLAAALAWHVGDEKRPQPRGDPSCRGDGQPTTCTRGPNGLSRDRQAGRLNDGAKRIFPRGGVPAGVGGRGPRSDGSPAESIPGGSVG